MDENLKKEYDLIIYGTGLTECLVAAAASRIGKSVLHLDRNPYYGSQWTSHTLSSFLDWISSVKNNTEIKQDEPTSNTESIKIKPRNVYSNVQFKWCIPQSIPEIPESDQKEDEDESKCNIASQEEAKTKFSQETIMKESRRFNIDLAPKVLYSRGAMVELLISSNVARYAEFKSVNRLYCYLDSQKSLAAVPCSKAQVFSSQAVHFLQKRLLMSFLELALKHQERKEEWQEKAEEKLSLFLQSKKLSEDVRQYILNGMVMRGADVTVQEGLESLQMFLKCLGRYGPSAFLSCVYGSGELPQAFCRLSAVFEGTYILDRTIHSIKLSDDKVRSIVSEEQEIECKHLVMENSFIPKELIDENSTEENKSLISRGIVLLNADILQDFRKTNTSDTEESEEPSDSVPNCGVSLLVLDREGGGTVVVQQFSASTGTTAPNTYLLHLTCSSKGSAEEDLKGSLDLLLNHYSVHNHTKDVVLFEAFYNQESSFPVPSVPNLYSCGGPDASLDYTDPVERAKGIIQSVFGAQTEFMPRAPDPEEIIFEGEKREEENTEKKDDVEEKEDEKEKKDDVEEKEEEKEKKDDVEEKEVEKEKDELSSFSGNETNEPAALNSDIQTDCDKVIGNNSQDSMET